MLIHPALVHFPIALCFAALALEILGQALGRKEWVSAGLPLIAMTALGALAAVASGLLTPQEHKDVAPIALETHELAAFSGTGLILLTTVLRVVFRNDYTGRRPGVVLMTLALSALCFSGAGFMGGQLVFDYGAGVKMPR
ncbi:MAG: DUF2231 domain-containing protein [Myxococcota bacterium]